MSEETWTNGSRTVMHGLVPGLFACIENGRLVRATDALQAFDWLQGAVEMRDESRNTQGESIDGEPS